MAQKISQYLLIILVLSLGFGQLLRFPVFGLSFYFHDILVLLLLLLNYKIPNLAPPLGLKIFFLGLGLGWLFAFTLYPALLLIVPSLYTLRLLAYLALYFQLKSTKVVFSSSYFIMSGFITLIIGLTQYLLMPDMRIFQNLGWDDHWNRLTLPHFDPTFTAVMLSLALLSTVQALPRIWRLSSTGFLVSGILLTYSRSVWLSLVLTFGYFMLKNKKLSYLLIGICLLIIPLALLPKRLGEGTNLFRTYSISSRLVSDQNYVQQYNWDLLLGRGLNTLVLDQGFTHATGPNNSYLYLLLTSGVLGLIGWVMFMFSLYRQSRYKPLLIFFFLASLFNNVMFYPFALLWILLVQLKVPSAT